MAMFKIFVNILPLLLLGASLENPQQMLQQYQDFKDGQKIFYDPDEDPGRYENFKKSLELVASLNSDDTRTADFGVNFFSTLSAAEKLTYLGMNISQIDENPAPAAIPSLADLPTHKLWTDEDAVVSTGDKQKECSASWAFAAVTVITAQYKQKTGKLRRFSEQELLDCAYPYGVDACAGGSYNRAYQYMVDSGRLGWNHWHQYPYNAVSCHCNSDKKRNYLVAQAVTGYETVPGAEESHIVALSHTAVSAAFEVTEAFMQYQGGVVRDTGCTGQANHAIGLVGYTPDYILAQNSWGHKWGDKGFVKFARNHDNCGLWKYSSYPTLVDTGNPDTLDEDDPVAYNATLSDPHPNCAEFTDTERGCTRSKCDNEPSDGPYWNEKCKATCNNCQEKFKFPDPSPNCDRLTDVAEDCDPVKCLKYYSERYTKGLCLGTCNFCPNPRKVVPPHPNCHNMTDRRDGCKLENCFRYDHFSGDYECEGTCNFCEEPVKFGPVHPDCPYLTDIRSNCDKFECIRTDSESYKHSQCRGTCNNCPVPMKEPLEHPDCPNLSDKKTRCELKYCHTETAKDLCQGTCNFCDEPIKVGPPHPDCAHFTDLRSDCDRFECDTYSSYMQFQCKGTCNNCTEPTKTPLEHPDCPNLSDKRADCRLKYCGLYPYYETECQGTCNYCDEPVKFGPPHADCPYFTDFSSNCDKFKCMTSQYDEYREYRCKGTCNNCPEPKKTPLPHPDCPNLTDTRAGCTLSSCTYESRRKYCEGTCNFCEEPVKIGPAHPDCPYFTDIKSNCDKFRCMWDNSERYQQYDCKGTCNNCPVPKKKPLQHPDCPNLTDKKKYCSVMYCYTETAKNLCQGTCNYCDEPIKPLKPHPDCRFYSDFRENDCDIMRCATAHPDYANIRCRGTCNYCPQPYKVPEPDPNCQNFTDVRANCDRNYCANTNYRVNQCAATCNFCKHGNL